MKISFEKEDKTGQQCPFSRKYKGLFFWGFYGPLLFGRLLLFIFDKIPRAMLIWEATTIWQVRVAPLYRKNSSSCFCISIVFFIWKLISVSCSLIGSEIKYGRDWVIENHTGPKIYY